MSRNSIGMKLATLLLLLHGGAVAAVAQNVVFWQEGFPTVDSQRVTRQTLERALPGALFANRDELCSATALKNAELLVLPYGSAFPADCWSEIHGYLQRGGNLLVLGGEAFYVPVRWQDGHFTTERQQPSYARELGFRNAYELPSTTSGKFAWKHGYEFLPKLSLNARRYFVMEGNVDGLGFALDAQGAPISAPVIVSDFSENNRQSARIVSLDFEPEAGFWESADGATLIASAVEYARRGTMSFTLETQYAALTPGESPQVTVHLKRSGTEERGKPSGGTVTVQLFSGEKLIDKKKLDAADADFNSKVDFTKALPEGFYTLRAVFEEDGARREFAENGFWVEDPAVLRAGAKLGISDDFLTRDGKPFFPVGTNYFTTENGNWDFSSARNAQVWENDFAEMERNGVSFVRTGVWVANKTFLNPKTNQASTRFLRNLEGFLLCAQHHGIAINFTFFAFAPQVKDPGTENPPNPYLDAGAVRDEQAYVTSVVERFKDVPFLSWDLINEPSFSNPKRLWKGNTPNRDPAETAAWHQWLRERYVSIQTLADAWSVAPEALGNFDSVPLPADDDFVSGRCCSTTKVRAFDYNLFAQNSFAAWVAKMVTAIRDTGSTQLINVGQDEGGVTDRVLNHFYAAAGVSFTTNHTYWQDDFLLWDSVASKVPGIPNIVGETGYQPEWSSAGEWRYDEFTGRNLLERKWVLGFAAGTSGAMQWDWARESDFGMKRNDLSNKTFLPVFRGVAEFAHAAAPYATSLIEPEIAVVLPQSEQLTADTRFALEAQQKAVAAIYGYARSEAYTVGEYQLERLGSPKLIIVPAPNVFDAASWETIAAKVREGAALLVSGDFARDAHFRRNGAEKILGLSYIPAPLAEREILILNSGGKDIFNGANLLHFNSEKAALLNRAVLPQGGNWVETTLGKGKVLFSTLPLELGDNPETIAAVYGHAMQVAGVGQTYTTSETSPDVLIVPTRLPHATLYVVTSEGAARVVNFRDTRSGKNIALSLGAGRAAMALIDEHGRVLASYN